MNRSFVLFFRRLNFILKDGKREFLNILSSIHNLRLWKDSALNFLKYADSSMHSLFCMNQARESSWEVSTSFYSPTIVCTKVFKCEIFWLLSLVASVPHKFRWYNKALLVRPIQVQDPHYTLANVPLSTTLSESSYLAFTHEHFFLSFLLSF